MRNGDWIQYHIGDLVCDLDDERHIGRVEAIWNAHLVKIRWIERGWISLVPISRLKKVND